MGWFYVAYMEEFRVDRQGASWPGSVLNSTFRCAGLLVTLLHKYLSLFWIGLLGSVMLWSSLIASAFAPSIGWMTATIGVAYGTGSGVVLVTHIVLIMQYFRKYRGIAAGLRLSSNPASAIVFPAVLSALRDAYGFRGASLVFGAITIHVTAFCIMLREPPWLTSNRPKKAAALTGTKDGETESASSNGCEDSTVLKKDRQAIVAGDNEVVKEKPNVGDLLVAEAQALIPDLTPRRSSSVSNMQGVTGSDLCRSSEFSGSKVQGPSQTLSEPDTQKRNWLVSMLQRKKVSRKHDVETMNSESKGSNTERQELSSRTASSVTSRLLPVHHDTRKPCRDAERDFSESQGVQHCAVRNDLPWLPRGLLPRLFKLLESARLPSPAFTVAVLISLLLDYVNSVHLTTMVDYARDKGVSPVQATMTIAYAAAPEILGRILLPLIADLGWVTRPTLFCGALFSLALLFAITPEMMVVAHVVVRAVSSVSMAGLLTMRQVLIADYLGAEAVSLVMGAAGVLLVPVQLTNPMIIGHFRDTAGSYDNLYRITAGLLLCTALVLAGFIISSRRTKPAAAEEDACGP
ncbi:hypothetical protein V5799_031458 [Amblyomma americanum]|uniref:Monocarboxylate transporter n=1 Tax=Amblyomma americanum TaxID=6943 RepID=A0AAQ4EKD6_AMBAM